MRFGFLTALVVCLVFAGDARPASAQPCPCGIWSDSTSPGANSQDAGALELGVKFRADTAGYISAIRFYKYGQNTGTHVGNLWAADGTLLGTVTFSSESASGWQTATFASPIAISAATTYVASYHTNTGYYAFTSNAFASSIDAGPLHLLSDAASGGNGVYRYSFSSTFPNQTYHATNYWVDVVFLDASPADTTPPTVTSVTPAINATNVSTTTAVTARFSEAMDPTRITTATVALRAGAAIVPAAVAYANSVVTLTPSAALAANTTFTATIAGGAEGVVDLAGNVLASDVTWSFTTGAAGGCPCSIWTLATTPGANGNEPAALELGVKFRADSSGFITGLRFYKYAQNTGQHVGNLWTSGGALLGTVTFTNESASGWQEATFTTPVAIAAATTYVASYHTNTGFYAATNFGFASGVDSGPLHALSDAAGNGNGVYRYTSTSQFPSQTYQAANYWVDVVFTTSGGADTTAPTVTSVTPAANTTGVGTSSAVTATFSEAMDPTSITSTTITLRANGTAVAASVGYAGGIATLTPSAALTGGTVYTATVKGGSAGVRDLAGNPLAADLIWTFTTAASSATCPCTIWPSGATAGGNGNDASALELGVKFRSDASGYITGLRFYKYAQNTGTHVGNLWSTSGTLLGSVTFTNESASGWQQAAFPAPIAISAATTYVASYHTNVGYYAASNGGLNTGVDAGPLHALSNGASGGNGVYRYTSVSAFPSQSYQGTNYWVDVVFNTVVTIDTTAPVVASVSPASGSTGGVTSAPLTVTFNEAIDPATITAQSLSLRSGATSVAATVSYANTVATLTPSAALAPATVYTATVKGGASGVKDVAGNALAADVVWSFMTAPAAIAPTQGAGGPILVVTNPGKPFTRYYAEILRAEGLNTFDVSDISDVTATLLGNYEVAIVGEQSLSGGQITMFTNWVASGGNLIAMRPQKELANLLGLTDDGGSLSDGYIAIDTSRAPGAGIVGQTMQFHGASNRYLPNGASVIATLYSDATTATAYAAVSLKAGTGGAGSVAAFAYDLAKSVVYTRQGNPAWARQERDGFAPIRADDLFYGAKAGDIQPDWVDLTRVAIPQADEQQRLLANLILYMNQGRTPLPRLWYLPRGLKAAVIMTGDDHASAGGTAGRFDIYKSNSSLNCSVANWECVRATSYIFPTTPITPAQVAQYIAEGFEIAEHMWMSGQNSGSTNVSTVCNDFSASSIAADYSLQRALFASIFAAAMPIRTNRTHCIVWSDYDSQPTVALANGIRFDTNYYYWPTNWTNDVPGLFTGSGLPMRFTKADGTMIDVYQAVTQMTDESGQTYPKNVDVLLDNALGATGFYGTFAANMHTDNAVHPGSVAIVASAQARGVPVVSAAQMLAWIDGRNTTAFGGLTWSGHVLGFTVVPGTGANGLQVLIPIAAGSSTLTSITLDGAPVSYTTKTIKGVSYAAIAVAIGRYQVTYTP